MKKAEFIARHGEEAYTNRLEEEAERVAVWRDNNPDNVRRTNAEIGRKDGKYYKKHQIYNKTGLRGERAKLRCRHGKLWQKYKRIIAPDSQIHHQWKPNSAEYVGVALVEKDAHMRGFINVIEVLDGEVNIFTEKELAGRGELQWQ